MAFSCFLLMMVIGVSAFMYYQSRNSAGLLEISSENGNYYIDPDSGIRISGIDIDGTTYFFLPSFINNEKIEQISESIRIYSVDGGIMARASFGEIQDILVDYGDGQMIPWRMCFMKSDNISSMFIDPKNGMDISGITRETYIDAGMTVYSPEGAADFSSERIMLKGRGNYSWQPDKKPMELKLNEKASICGMSPSKKWVLLSDYYDPTMMLNKLAMDLAKDIGVGHTSDSDWVDVYVGGMYMGNYLLCREPGTTAGDTELLFRKEIPHTYKKKPNKFMSCGMGFVIDVPDEVSRERIEDIRKYVDGIDAAIRSGAYEECMDEESFIKRYLIEEFFFNADALSHSYYFYKYPGDPKLYAGPCWDYDLAGGGFFGARGLYYDYNVSITEMTENSEYVMDKEEWIDWDIVLLGYPGYLLDAGAIYHSDLDKFRDVVYNGIDSAYETIKSSAEMDNVRWKDKGRHYYSYENEIRHLKFFLSHRLEHMDDFLRIQGEEYDDDTDRNEYHKVTFMLPDGTEERIEVPDGTRLTEDELPQKAEDGYGWVKDINDEALFSEFFPVYEDTIYVLKEISYES